MSNAKRMCQVCEEEACELFVYDLCQKCLFRMALVKISVGHGVSIDDSILIADNVMQLVHVMYLLSQGEVMAAVKQLGGKLN